MRAIAEGGPLRSVAIGDASHGWAAEIAYDIHSVAGGPGYGVRAAYSVPKGRMWALEGR